MAMVLNAFVELFVQRLAVLAEEEIGMQIGVEDDLIHLKENLVRIKAILADAESKKISQKSISIWLAELRELMYDSDDLLDDCCLEAESNHFSSAVAAIERSGPPSSSPSSSRRYHFPSFLSCLFSVPFRHKIGKRIQGINSALEKLDSEIPRLNLVSNISDPDGTLHQASRSVRRDTSPVIVESEIVGIDEDTKRLIDMLICGGTRKSKCPVYAITGMPGIGKTTLAKKVFNDPQIKSHFEIVMWVCVSKGYEDVDLLKEIVRSITQRENMEKGRGEVYGDANRKAELCPIISELVENKRFLLVLDDIWEAKVWEDLLRPPLHDASNNSRVLITTRNHGVALGMRAVYVHKVKELPQKEGWSMLCKAVFGDDEEGEMNKLKNIGMEIANKCKCLPLAIKAVGGVLKGKERNVKAWDRVCSSQTWALTGLPEDIKPGLLLSYEDLPSHLKQCFIYCSLFPEDFKFHQPNLVQMWIAEGFIESGGGTAMEELGDDYYKELVMRNLLQAVPDYYDGLGCKMHDLVRSLALYVSQNDYIYKDPHALTCSSMKLRHLSFVKKEADMVPEMNKKHECLRTLLLSRNPLIKVIPPELFDKLRRLRVLDMTYTGIESLPDSLGNLIHLRFLNVSFTKLKALPDSIQNLRNLMTLKATGLKHLHRLPAGVVQLKNLRHITVGATETQLDNMPIGIGNLEKLRTLNGFVVNDGTASEGKQNEANMKELKNLSELTHLSVYRMERVASRADAEEAALGNKMSLRYLRLCCSRRIRAHQLEVGEIKRIEEVFEGINPPVNLEEIHIEGFFGHKFPSYIMGCSLRNLTWLRFNDCKLVRQLPPLGRLPELTVLQVWGATAVSKIGLEFFGGASGFPKLQELYLQAMPKLEWISKVEQGALPSLKKMQIIKCPKLKSLPSGLKHATSLTKLVIEDCENFEAIGNLSSVSELTIRGNSKLTSVSKLPALNILSISKCSSLSNVADVNNLRYLLLSDDNMEALPQWLTKTTALKKLDVKGSTHLVARLCNGGADWPIIENILQVEAKSGDGLSYISYRKDPFSLQSNLMDSIGVSSSSLTLNTMTSNVADEEYWSSSFISPYEP